MASMWNPIPGQSNIRDSHTTLNFQSLETEIDRSGFLLLLQDQKLLQNQKQVLLPDTGAPVGTGAPIRIGARV